MTETNIDFQGTLCTDLQANALCCSQYWTELYVLMAEQCWQHTSILAPVSACAGSSIYVQPHPSQSKMSVG